MREDLKLEIWKREGKEEGFVEIAEEVLTRERKKEWFEGVTRWNKFFEERAEFNELMNGEVSAVYFSIESWEGESEIEKALDKILGEFNKVIDQEKDTTCDSSDIWAIGSKLGEPFIVATGGDLGASIFVRKEGELYNWMKGLF